MKKLLLLMFSVLVALGTWAESSVTADESTGVVTINSENGDDFNKSNDMKNKLQEFSNAKKYTIVKMVGTFGGNDWGEIKNKINNSTFTTIDASGATYTDMNGNKFGDAPNSIKHIILSSTYTQYPDNFLQNVYSRLETITYKDVVANISGSTATIQLSGTTENEDETFLKELLKNKGQYSTVNVVAAVVSTFEDGVLTLSKADGASGDAIKAAMEKLNAEVANVTKVVFEDGSVWEDGKLTSTVNPDTHEQALKDAGFTVSSVAIKQSLGKYVSIITENGETITQINSNGVTSNNLDNWPDITNDEKNAIGNAQKIKLVGAYTGDVVRAIGNKNKNYTYLDMTDATFASDFTQLNTLADTSTLKTLKLPTSMEEVPAAFASGFTALEDLTMPEGLKKIGGTSGNGAFMGCTSLKAVNFPQSLEEIGIDAFKKCYSIEVVDLSNLPKLWKIDAAAFNMDDTNSGSKLTKVILPTSDNTTLRFFGNQVFSCAPVKELDFSHCLGITNFAYDGMNVFEEQGHTGTTTTSKETFTWYSSLESIKLPPNLAHVAEKAFNECKNLKSVEFTGKAVYGNDCKLTNPLTIGDFAFQNCTALSDVQLSNNVTYIGTKTFSQIAIRQISIPASVETIRGGAFENCDDLTVVVFEDIQDDCKCGDTDELAKATATQIGFGDGKEGSGAFNNCEGITDVYINSSAQISCENGTFDPAHTYGRSDVNAHFATLHFPKQYLSHYVNLEHYITDEIAADAGKFQTWLIDHYKAADNAKSGFGWYEFINAGPMSDDPGKEPTYEGGIILRTFSDYNYAYLVPDGLRAYIVNGINTNSDGNYEVSLQRLLVIPAKTGVILYGHPNSKNMDGVPTLSLTPIKFAEGNGAALCRANWDNLKDQDLKYKNYLEPTSTPTEADLDIYKGAEREAVDALIAEHSADWKNGGKYVKPFENVEGKDDPMKVNTQEDVAFRNFSLGRYNSTDASIWKRAELGANDDNYAAFFRMKAGFYSNGKAYLHVAADEYNKPNGAEILVKKDESSDFGYYYEYEKTQAATPINFRMGDYATSVGGKNPNGWWRADLGFDWDIYDTTTLYGAKRENWGKRPATMNSNPELAPLFLGELENDIDGVVKVVIPAEVFGGDYYTLQGVKVANPTKGVYIRNGKKVVIK